MNKGIVYIATCKINGKKYVGQTTKTLAERIKQHGKAGKSNAASFSLFTKAIQEHGIENFEWEVYCKCNYAELSEKEIETIEKFNTTINGYNLTLGGIGRLGYKHSEATKQKMSKAAQNMTIEHRRKISKALKGKSLPKETRQKISNSLKGNTNAKGHTLPEEHRNKVGDIWRGKKITEDVKRKIREALQGREFTEEWRNKLGKSVTINGVTYPTRVKAAEALGLKYPTFMSRLQRGYFEDGNQVKTQAKRTESR